MGRRGGLLLLVGVGVIWGTIGVAAKLLYRETGLDAAAVTWLRAVIAAPVAVGFAWRALGRRLFAASRRDLGLMAGLGVVVIVYQYLYLAAVDVLGVAVATLIALCVPPVLVALLSPVMFGEQLGRRRIVAVGVAVAGTALLVGRPSGKWGEGSVEVGLALALGSAGLLAGHALGSRVLAARQHPWRPPAVAFPVGVLAFAPVALTQGMSLDLPLAGWAWLLYLGLVPSALGYWMYQRALTVVTATTASVVTLLEPLVAAILAWAVFGERLGAVGWVGAALLIGAITLLRTED